MTPSVVPPGIGAPPPVRLTFGREGGCRVLFAHREGRPRRAIADADLWRAGSGVQRRPPWRTAFPIGLAAIFLLAGVRPAHAQVPPPPGGDRQLRPGAESQAVQERQDCDVPHHEGLTSLTLSNGSRVLYFRFPRIRCEEGIEIAADSAVVYESTSYNQLFGHVVFEDQEGRLTADEAQYFDREGRLRAWGNATLVDHSEGSVIRGDTMVLLRAGAAGGEDRLTVTGRRPHATLFPARASGPPAGSPSAGRTAQVGGEGGEASSRGVTPDSASSGGGAGAKPDSAAAVRAAARPDSLALAATIRPDTDSAALRREPLRVPDSAVAAEPARPEEAVPAEPADRKPYEVSARRMVLEGSRYFSAVGEVEVRRDSLTALADSMAYEEEAGLISFHREAQLRTDRYDLAADTIRLEISGDEVNAVQAGEEGVLKNEDMHVLAPRIALFFTDGRMERLVAVRWPPRDSLPEEVAETEGTHPPAPEAAEEGGERGAPHPAAAEIGLTAFPNRPYAVAQDFILTADSVEVFAPGEVLEEVWAMGEAHGESMARDSLNTADTPPLLRRDWLEGDTIIAVFSQGVDSVSILEEPAEAAPPPEGELPDSTASRYKLERLIARVGARSLYRLEASDSTVAEEEKRLAVHYVVGDEITIYMSEGEVEHMEVTGATRGIHLEPVGRSRSEGAGSVSGEKAPNREPDS